MYIYLPWQYLSYAEAHPVLRKAKNVFYVFAFIR